PPRASPGARSGRDDPPVVRTQEGRPARAVGLPVVALEERLRRRPEPRRIRGRATAAPLRHELRDGGVILLLGALARRRIRLAGLVVERRAFHARVGRLHVTPDDGRHVLRERLLDTVLALPRGRVW